MGRTVMLKLAIFTVRLQAYVLFRVSFKKFAFLLRSQRENFVSYSKIVVRIKSDNSYKYIQQILFYHHWKYKRDVGKTTNGFAIYIVVVRSIAVLRDSRVKFLVFDKTLPSQLSFEELCTLLKFGTVLNLTSFQARHSCQVPSSNSSYFTSSNIMLQFHK